MSIAKNRASRPKPDRPVRRRRSAQEAKAETLAAARKILLEQGPDAVTLKNVAGELGTTHTNLLHHFGTAGELQSSLMSMMVRDLSDALGSAVAMLRTDEDAPRALIETVFDAFDKGGAGRLAAWIALSDNFEHLDQVQQAVTDLVKAIEEKFGNAGSDTHERVTSAVIFLTFMAFGDSVVGFPLRNMLDREPTAGRAIAAQLLSQFF